MTEVSNTVTNTVASATILQFKPRNITNIVTNTVTNGVVDVSSDVTTADVSSDASIEETEKKSAEIIQIYVDIDDKFAEQVANSYAPELAVSQDQDRLQNALKRLQAALAEQKEAVAAWRESLATLHSTMTNMGNTYQSISDNLSTAKSGLDKATQLSLDTVKILDDSGLTKPE